MSDQRVLPSIERLLGDPGIAALMATASRSAVVAAVRESVESARKGRAGIPDDWAAAVADRLHARRHSSLIPVLNATGVVLHTNLGRAPLARAAIEAMVAVGSGYSTLELDRAAGIRGSRGDHARAHLMGLTGAEDALVVNNAAAALALAVHALAGAGEVVISRGELIEIGGSFRIPDVIAASGARLREVGTTNRTHVDDYREAFPGARAVLIVHRSNFTQRGFVATPAPRDIVAAARSASIPLIYDVGGGLLRDLSAYGLTGEPLVRDAIEAGADLVVFSGDKLLGGPQAGIIAGRRESVARCRRDPYARAVRPDNLTLAALEATLALLEEPERALREIPALAMLTASEELIRSRAEVLARACGSGVMAKLSSGTSAAGGGAFPDAKLPTTVVRIDPGPLGADALALRLRLGDPCVIARVADGAVLLDPRTLPDDALADVAGAVRRALDSD